MGKINKVFMILSVVYVMFGMATSKLTASEVDQSVIDLSGLTNREIAQKLDKSPKTQDFIVLNDEQLKQKSGYRITEVVAKEDFSNVNSTMWGKYEVYKVNGHFVFCIEPGYDTLNNGQSLGETGSVYSKFSKSSKTYISRVISSSVGNYKKTNNDAFIFAGQLLIWDYVSANEADVIGNAMASWNPEYLNSWTINKSVYSPQIKVIEKELSTWSTLPSFLKSSSSQAKPYVLTYDKGKDEFSITLKDTNGVWDEKYANYKTVGDYKLSNPAGKDNLKISTRKEQVTAYKSTDFSWSPYISDTKELYDAGQELIYVGATPVKGYIKFKTEPYPKGGFELRKEGEQPEGKPLAISNVKFKVTGTGFDKDYTTDSLGKITVTNELVPGKYHIKEISAPTKYNMNFEQDFTVNPGEVTNLNSGNPIINTLYYNKIRFLKVGQSFVNGDGEVSPLSGVKFELYKEAGDANQIIDEGDELVAELVSDEEGIVESGKLYEGNYILKEVATNPGYLLNTQTYSFKVSNTGEITNKTTIDLGTLTNEVIEGRVQLEKIGVGSCEKLEDCSVPLKNVKFDVYADVDNSGDIDESESIPITQIVTDNTGIGISGMLKYGHYFLKEADNPYNNYQMTDTMYEFDIDEPDQVVYVNDGKPIENSEKTGAVEITKRGESISNTDKDISLLAGATYQISDEKGKVIGELTTDKGGKASLENLSFGKYQIKETNAPEGYVVDSTPYEFEINDDTYEQPIALEFSDDVIKNKIEISKVDASNKKELAGAKLVVRDRNTREVVEEWTSTTTPHEFEVNYGEYEICEIAAPAGYKQTTSCTNFEVAENGISQSFKIENKRMKIAITGSSSKRTWIIILLIAILIVLMTLYIRIYIRKVKS